MHDGSNGMLASALWKGSAQRFGEAFRDLQAQLQQALVLAVERALVRRADGCQGLELHIWSTCNQGRHRSVCFARCLRECLATQVTQHVVVLYHHLRAGPHDDRGPCGCSDERCSLYARTRELDVKSAQLRREVEVAAASLFEASGGDEWRASVKAALRRLGEGALAASAPGARPTYRQLVEKVYAVANPRALTDGKVEELFEKYARCEKELYLAVCRKYGVEPVDPAAMGSGDRREPEGDGGATASAAPPEPEGDGALRRRRWFG